MTDAVAVAGMQEHIPFDPYAYGFHEDPYPTYARLRREAPVYYNSELDFWALARHADVRSAFRDSVNLSNAWGVSMDPASYGPDAHKSMSFLALDDPKHMRIRKLVSKGFTPRRVNDLSGRITALTHEHWSRCLDKGEFDYVADFAGLLPMDVVSELLASPRVTGRSCASSRICCCIARRGCSTSPKRPCTRISNCTNTIRR